MKVTGSIRPQNKPAQVGNIQEDAIHVYKMPVHEKKSLKFAVKGVKVLKCELMVDNVLISMLRPKYEREWTSDTITPIYFLGLKADGGKDILFHRGLLDCPVEIILSTTELDMPSIMVGFSDSDVTWDNIEGAVYTEKVTVGSDSGEKTMTLVYTTHGCGFMQ